MPRVIRFLVAHNSLNFLSCSLRLTDRLGAFAVRAYLRVLLLAANPGVQAFGAVQLNEFLHGRKLYVIRSRCQTDYFRMCADHCAAQISEVLPGDGRSCEESAPGNGCRRNKCFPRNGCPTIPEAPSSRRHCSG